MKEKFVITLACCLLVTPHILKAQGNADLSATFNAVEKGYQLLFSDEFNNMGKPNEKDWFFRNNKKMGGASVPQNVVLGKATDASGAACLLINFTYDSTLPKDDQFKGGGVISTHNFGYGYYETRVKLYGGSQEMSGLHQSFWSMGLTGTNEGEGKGVRDVLVNADAIPQENRVLEIDGFEHNSRDNVLAQNHHIYTPTHISKAPKNNQEKKDLSQWIVMGYEWLPDRINFYCDGRYTSTKFLTDKWKVFAPQNFWITALPVSTKWWGILAIPPKDAAMQVDYFRYYTKKLPETNLIGNASFEYGGIGNDYPISWIIPQKDKIQNAIRVIKDSIGAKEGTRYLQFKFDKKGMATVKQILEYIPNGKYEVSAWVRGSEGQKSSLIVNVGSENKMIAINPTDKWKKIELNDFFVMDNKAIVEIQATANEGQWLNVDEVEFKLLK